MSANEVIEDILDVNGSLSHFGIKGMKWGVRRSQLHPDIANVPKRTRKEAKKDAEEFTRAKLFFGVGAGTRRKLIKAKVETRKEKDKLYAKAFDHYVKQTDLGKRAEQARSERKRKDVASYTKKTAKGVGHVTRGNTQYANTSAQIGVASARYLLKNLQQSDNSNSMTQSTIDDILEHHGTKGMKWGVRRAQRKLDRGDRKFRKNAISLKGRIEVNNAAADHFNKNIDAINNKSHYVAARDRGDLLNPKSSISKQYNKEVSNLYMDSVRKALSAQGTNPSGTKKLELRPTGDFEYEVALVDVKHADEMFSIIFERDENGMITGVRLNEMMQSDVSIDNILHISEQPWSSYTEADYTIEQWHAACLIHIHDGPPTSKTQCKLPVKTPNGALNRNGVHAAAAALAGARSPLKASSEQKAKAASALRRYYSQLEETPPDSLAQSSIDDILTHFGVKGMKWGVRRKATVGAQEVVISDKRKGLKTTGGQGHPAHDDALRARTSGQIGKKSGVKALSNAELKAFNERLNLEQNYKRLKYEDSSAGQKFVLSALRQTGKQSSQDLGTEGAKQVKRVIKIAATAAAA